jgi:hypothetical protein
VIVRLMGDAQYRVHDELREKLNELDDQAAEALERNDEAAMDGFLDQMWKLVQAEGELVPFDDLHPSDALIPPSDLSLEETRQLFSEDGLIPDLPSSASG